MHASRLLSLSFNCTELTSASAKHTQPNSFIDASLSIRRTTHAHMYQLVVTRAFEEGEEQLLDEDAESEGRDSENVETPRGQEWRH